MNSHSSPGTVWAVYGDCCPWCRLCDAYSATLAAASWLLNFVRRTVWNSNFGQIQFTRTVRHSAHHTVRYTQFGQQLGWNVINFFGSSPDILRHYASARVRIASAFYDWLQPFSIACRKFRSYFVCASRTTLLVSSATAAFGRTHSTLSKLNCSDCVRRMEKRQRARKMRKDENSKRELKFQKKEPLKGCYSSCVCVFCLESQV